MKHSIKKRFISFGVIMTIGFIMLNITITNFLMIPFSVKCWTMQLDKIADDIEKLDVSDYEFREYMEHVEEDINTRITIVDGGGYVVASTSDTLKEQKILDKNNHAYKMLFDNKEALDKGETFSSSKTFGNKNRDGVRIFLIHKVGTDRYVILSRSYRSLLNSLKITILFEIIAGVVLLALGLVLVCRWSFHFSKPILQITDAAEHISNLDFDTRVDVCCDDELGKLADAVNRMSEHLQDNVEQMQEDIEKRKRLVRNLSHEIKSPIAVIMGYSDRMKAIITKNPEKAVSYCEIISDESNRIDMLVKEMLEFSKLEQEYGEPKCDKLETKRFFGELEKRFYQENPDTVIQFKTEYDEQDVIYADYVMTERAVYNLIRNAVTYATGEPPIIKVSGKRNEDCYEFTVYNSGSFIPDEDIQTVWEPFGKVDKVRGRSKKGYGLGLSIVREIVEKHNGYYRVNNLEDGVAFVIAIRIPKACNIQ